LFFEAGKPVHECEAEVSSAIWSFQRSTWQR